MSLLEFHRHRHRWETVTALMRILRIIKEILASSPHRLITRSTFEPGRLLRDIMEKENGIKKTEEDDSEKIRRLEATNFQLKQVIMKLTRQKSKEEQASDQGSSKKKGRPFDSNLYTKRHVALHVCYFGWDFHGFALQEITGRTIESELFHALTLTKLITKREESNYHRCGRTDKGVSAFQQVITVFLKLKICFVSSRIS